MCFNIIRWVILSHDYSFRGVQMICRDTSTKHRFAILCQTIMQRSTKIVFNKLYPLPISVHYHIVVSTFIFRPLPISAWLDFALDRGSGPLPRRKCLNPVQRHFRRDRGHRSYLHHDSSLLRSVAYMLELLLHDSSELWKTRGWRCSDKRCKLWRIASKLLCGIAFGSKVGADAELHVALANFSVSSSFDLPSSRIRLCGAKFETCFMHHIPLTMAGPSFVILCFLVSK